MAAPLTQADTVPLDFVQEEVRVPFGAQEEQNVTVSPELADKRTNMFTASGLSDLLGRDVNTIRAEIQSGKEKELRAEVANKMQLKELTRRQNAITEIVRQRKAPLTIEEYNKVLNAPTNFDPDTVLEQEYANYFVNLLDNQKEGVGQEAKDKDPSAYSKTLNVSSELTSKNQLIDTFIDNANEAVSKQSTVGYILDVAKGAIPLYTELKSRGYVPNVGYFDGILQGNNVEQQALQLYSMPLDQMKTVLQTAQQRMGADNPGLFQSWLNEIKGQSTTEKFLNNFFTFLDLATFPGVATGAKLTGKATGLLRAELKAAAKDTVKGAAAKDATRASVAEAAGDLETAAVNQASNRMLNSIRVQTSGPARVADALKDIPTAFKSQMNAFMENPGNYAREGALRLQRMTENSIDNIVNAMGNRLQVERLGILESSEAVMRELHKSLGSLYPRLRNNILDASNVKYDPVTNTYPVDLILGRNNTTLFASWNEANNFARANGLESNLIKKNQLGTGYYIRATKPLNETDDIIRDLLISTKGTKDPDGWINAFIGWLRNPDETLSMEQRMNRKAATYSASVLLKMAKDDTKYIADLARGVVKTDPDTGKPIERIFRGRKKRWDEFNRTLNANKEGDGTWFNNAGELENFYQTNFKRLPDEAEIHAYFAYKRITEMDHALRSLSLYRNKTRLGVEQHSFSYKDPSGNKVTIPFFDGVLRRDLPTRDKNSILVMGKTGFQVFDTGHYPITSKKWLQDEVRSGRMKIIEVYDPETRPFAGIVKDGQSYIRYVAVSNFESKPIQYADQLPRKAGGHYEYDYEHYIKQAKIAVQRTGKNVVHRYLGDSTIAGVPVRAMGQDFAKSLDEIRTFLRRKDGTGAKAAYDKSKLPIPFEEIQNWFKSHKIDGVTVPARLDLNEPIRVVPRGKRLSDLDSSIQDRYPKTFTDGTKEGSLARQHTVDFTGERDVHELFAVNNEGTRYNPIWKWERAKFVDPLTTMDRAFSRIAQSQVMDDYKIFSVENWMQQARNYFKDPDKAIRTPYHSFSNPDWRPGVPPEIKANLERSRWQIQQFLGQRTTTDNLLHSAAQKLADTIYSTAGGKGFIVDPLQVLPKLKDPFQFVRSIAFNAKLGLFSVPQLLVQLQTFGVIGGIAGWKHAAPGAAATLFSQWARINKNPAIIGKLDDIISKLRLPGTARWLPGEFTESMEALEKTGFMNVGREVATYDDVVGPRLLSSRGSQFLDAGQIFFREGERASRTGAWHTAYKEFRTANPTGRLTNNDIRQILERADTLTVNMSRASSSLLHTGVMSIPAQFLAYNIRLAELVWGKRLTAMEKARLLGVQSVLYGVPTALGITGLPLADFLRKNAIENGYVVGDNAFEQFATEGLPALMLGIVTGNQYNVGDRWGPSGFETIREAMRGDRTWYEVAGGASFSVLSSVWSASDGFMNAMLSGLRDDDKKFPATIEDVSDLFKEITSFNQAWKAYMAIQTGRWLSKKEMYLTDVSASNALFMAITGLQPQGVADLQLQSWSQKDENEKNKYIGEQFTQEFRRALREHDQNPEQAKKYFTRAFNLLNISGYPEDKKATLLARATKDYESLIESMNWSFYADNVPELQRDTRLKALTKILKQQQQQRGK